MKQVVFASLFVFFILSLNQTASAQNEIYGDDVEDLKTIYAKLDKAAKNADLRTFEKYLGENYRLETVDESLNKRQTLVRLKSQFALTDEISEAISTIDDVKAIGDKYVLDVTSVLVGELAMPNGKLVKFSITSKSTDVWHRNRQGNWQVQRQIDLGNKIEIERKKINLA